MSLIPQSILRGAAAFGTTLLFTAVDFVELAGWFWMLSGTAHALSERIARPSFRRRMEQISYLRRAPARRVGSAVRGSSGHGWRG